MKSTFTLLFITILCAAKAQTINLETFTPAPRVGDPVEFYFSGEFLAKEISTKVKNAVYYDTIIPRRYTSHYNNNFGFTLVFEDTGKQIVGPFEFVLNGKTYTTDSVEINVSEPLPWEEGLWIRYEKIAHKHYVVIEQLTAKMDDGFMEPTKMLSDSTNNMVCSRSSSRHTNYLNDKDNIESPKLAYAMYLYHIELKDIDSLLLTKEHFINLPSNFKWKPLLISNN